MGDYSLKSLTYQLGQAGGYIVNSSFFMVFFASMVVLYKTKRFDIVSFLLVAILSSFFYIFYNSMTGTNMAGSVSTVGYPPAYD